MAKSLRSKWRRKMRSEKRKKLEPKFTTRLERIVKVEHVPTLTEIEAKEKEAAELAKTSDEMEAVKSTTDSSSRIRPWMNQRRVKRMAASAKVRGNANSASAKLVSTEPKHQPRIRVAMKKRHKGKQRKLNKRLHRVASFPVS